MKRTNSKALLTHPHKSKMLNFLRLFLMRYRGYVRRWCAVKPCRSSAWITFIFLPEADHLLWWLCMSLHVVVTVLPFPLLICLTCTVHRMWTRQLSDASANDERVRASQKLQMLLIQTLWLLSGCNLYSHVRIRAAFLHSNFCIKQKWIQIQVPVVNVNVRFVSP